MIRVIQLPLAALLTLCFLSTASAKVVYDDVADLIGTKHLVTYFKAAPALTTSQTKWAKSSKSTFSKLSKSSVKTASKKQKSNKPAWTKSKAQLVEFMFLGSTEMWLSDEDGVSDVRIAGLGSRHFEWEDRQGARYVI